MVRSLRCPTIRLGKRTENRTPLIKDFVPLIIWKILEFMAWDIFEYDAYEAALKAGVPEKELLDKNRTGTAFSETTKGGFQQ